MAERTTLLHVIFFLVFPYRGSSLAHNTTSGGVAVLDVSASIQKTLDILSFNLHQQEASSNNSTLSSSKTSSSFSLPLHPRSSISNFHFKDYKSLLLARLARDSARVNSILAKVNSLEITSSSKFLVVPVTSGESQGRGEYFARIGIGWPVKNYYWVIDTGSDISWLQCVRCNNCYKQSDPIYDPSMSSTYRSLSCRSAQCQALDDQSCRAGRCQYKVLYGDGSFTTGDFVMETLSFGFSGSVSRLSIGCGHDNEGLFGGAAGIIGLGGGPLSLPSQLEATSFSYCLVDADSTRSSTLDFNLGRLGNSITTPLVRNAKHATYRYIQLIDISVGGQRLGLRSSLFAVNYLGQGGTIIDSGTTVTRLVSPAYEALRNVFVRQAQNLRTSSGHQILDTCFILSLGKTTIPTVAFNFPGNQNLLLPAENILIPVDSNGKFCLAFAPTNSFSIIGNIQQQTIRINFDLDYDVVEFSPNRC